MRNYFTLFQGNPPSIDLGFLYYDRQKWEDMFGQGVEIRFSFFVIFCNDNNNNNNNNYYYYYYYYCYCYYYWLLWLKWFLLFSTAIPAPLFFRSCFFFFLSTDPCVCVICMNMGGRALPTFPSFHTENCIAGLPTIWNYSQTCT